MKSAVSNSVLAAVFAASLSVAFSVMPAQAATMKECAAQWKTMKDAKQTDGKTYRHFSKTCMSKDAAAAPAAKPDTAKKADAADKAAKPVSEGRAAAVARQKECGAEWKADKAAGKVEKGMKWPQYWSACSKRKKGQAA